MPTSPGEFINSHNGELLGAFGNFVNRSLVFVQKSFNSRVPSGQCSPAIRETLQELYPFVGKGIEQGNFKDGLDAVFAFIRSNLSILLKPYLPFSAEKIRQIFGIEKNEWSFTEIPAGLSLNDVRILFERIDKKKIREEEE